MSKTEFEFDLLTTLPDGWEWLPLEDLMDEPKRDIVDGPFGSNLKASEYVEEGIPIARLQNVDRNIFVHKNIKYLTMEKANELSRHTFKPGDILITKLGDPLGEACIAPSSIEHGVIVADLVRVRPAESKVDRQYLTYAINSPLVARQFEKHTKGTTRPRVNLGMIRKLPIPVAPREMQAGVVAEIEKQFSRLDEAVANLKRVKVNLKRYKVAVLKAAVEGRLVETEADLARREGRSFETGAQLLQRILETRRSRWRGKGKYKEPAALGTTDLPELPEGWVWASVQQLADIQLGKMLDRQKHRAGKEQPYLRNINVRWDSVNTADLLTMFFKDNEDGRYGLLPGDVLVCEGGEPGRAAVWDGRIPRMMYQKAIHRVRFLDGYEQRLLVFYLEFLAKIGRLERWFTGSTIKHFTRESFAQLPIPLAPANEQLRIVTEVDRRLSLVREFESQVDANSRRSDRLRQSILTEAFSGLLLQEDSVSKRIKSVIGG